MNLSLATFNVWFEEIGGYERIEHLKKVIEEIDGDIIGLQEVTDKFWSHLDFKSYPFKYYKKFSECEYGLAILSKFPILSCEFLYDNNEFEKSRAMHCLIDCDGIKISLANLHLPSESIIESEKQIVAIVKYTQKHRADYDFLIGDFNYSENSSIHRYLISEQSLREHETNPCWIDLYEIYSNYQGEKRPATLDISHNTRWRNSATRSVYGPGSAIDRIYISDNWNKVIRKSCSLFGTEINKVTGIHPSDHFGVNCHVEVFSQS